MTERHVSLKGWGAWWRRRKRELRSAGMNYILADRVATHESRVRARMKKIVGQGRARRFELLLCLGGKHDEPRFVIVDPIDDELWEQFADIPQLHRPFGSRPWGYV